MGTRTNNRSLGPFGDASLLILTSLAGGPRHGWALIQDIKDFGGVVVGAGTLYTALYRLESRGLVEALPEEDRRRPFRITAAGEAVLSEHVASLERVAAAGRARLRLGDAFA